MNTLRVTLYWLVAVAVVVLFVSAAISGQERRADLEKSDLQHTEGESWTLDYGDGVELRCTCEEKTLTERCVPVLTRFDHIAGRKIVWSVGGATTQFQVCRRATD